LIGFTGGTLDRADAIRHDPDTLAACIGDPRARLLRMDAYLPRVTDAGALEWGSLAEAEPDAPLVLLGLDGGEPRFAAAAGPAPGRSGALFAAIGRMQPEAAATWGAARSVLDWHARHGFCANCGAVTEPFRAGWGRRCPSCATEHFPRVDPVVIMLAEHGDRVLLGRQPAFPAGRYSALAGFLEPGESIEEAVRREVMEEAGVRVREVRYVASQPWPFPGQLMIACIGVAEDDAITLDRNELEDAIWVSRDDVRAVLAGEAGPFLPPPPYAIAHSLLEAWVRRA
jgi:NAD+ diphosphatase